MTKKATVKRGRKNTDHKNTDHAAEEALPIRVVSRPPAEEADEITDGAKSETTPRTDDTRDEAARKGEAARKPAPQKKVPQDTMRIPAYLLDSETVFTEDAKPVAPGKPKTPAKKKPQRADHHSGHKAEQRVEHKAEQYHESKSGHKTEQYSERKSEHHTGHKSEHHSGRRTEQRAVRKPDKRAPRREEYKSADAIAYERQTEEEARERARERERQLAIEEEQRRLKEERKRRKESAGEIRRRKEAEEARINAEVERRVRAAELEAEPQVIVSPRVKRQKRLTVAWVSVGVALLAMISIFIGIRYDRIRRELAAAETASMTEASVTETIEGGESEAFGETEGSSVTQVSVQDGIRRVYLTFDDGPSKVTDEILDILAEYHVKATFFVLGKDDEASLATYKRIVDEGHTLAMHGYTHDLTAIYASLDAFQSDLHRLRNLLYEATGEWCTIYRFPGGSSTTTARVDMADLIAYLGREQIVYYDWNVYGGDDISPEMIIANVRNNVEKYNNAVVLMHDAADKEETVEALPEIIEYIQGLDDTVLLPITDETVPVQHGNEP